MFRTKGEARQHLKDRARFGFDYRLPEPEVNERARQSPSGRGYAAQLALTEVVTRFDREAQAVERDDRLTSKGKAERLAELARESLKRVDVLRVRLYDSIESDLAELQKQAASPTRKPGDIEQLMLEREVSAEEINADLDQQNVVLITPLGVSPAGEIFNLAMEEVAEAVAADPGLLAVVGVRVHLRGEAGRLLLLGRETALRAGQGSGRAVNGVQIGHASLIPACRHRDPLPTALSPLGVAVTGPRGRPAIQSRG